MVKKESSDLVQKQARGGIETVAYISLEIQGPSPKVSLLINSLIGRVCSESSIRTMIPVLTVRAAQQEGF